MNKKRISIIISILLLTTTLSAAGTAHFMRAPAVFETYSNVKRIVENSNKDNFDNYQKNTPNTASRSIDSWPMFRHDPEHTGYSLYDAPYTNNTRWSQQIGLETESSPVYYDGKVYFGAKQGKVFCFDAISGNQLWNFTDIGEIEYSSPAISDDNLIIGSTDGKIYCINVTNRLLKWDYPTNGPIYSSPTIIDNNIYIGSYDGKMYCLDVETGDYIWSYPTEGQITSSAAISKSRVYFGSLDGKLYCLNAFDGTHIWNYTTGESIDQSSPTVVNDQVYFGSEDNNIYCIDAEYGNFIWSFTTGDKIVSSPAVAYGAVYIGSFDNKIYCLDAVGNGDGTTDIVWEYETGDNVFSSPAVADDMVYIGSNDQNIYCLDSSDGNLIWSYNTDSSVTSSPAIANKKVFIASSNGDLYAFEDSNYLMIENTNATQNDVGHIIPIYAEWSEYLYYYEMTINFDPLQIQINGVSTEGCVLEGAHPMLYVGDGYLNLAIIRWNYYFPPGEGCICTINVTINPEAGGRTFLNFTTSAKYVTPDYEYIYPDLINGYIDIPNEPPEIPPQPLGPISGGAGAEHTFTTTAVTDPDEHQTQYGWDWNGDLQVDQWTNFYNPGEDVNTTHIWINPGTFAIRVKARDPPGYESDWSDPSSITITSHPPNTPEQPLGPSIGAIGIKHSFSTYATDPDLGFIQYGWDWNGDLQVDEWTNFFDSGENIITNHTWHAIGTYDISVMANDLTDNISGWSTPLIINIINNHPEIPIKPVGNTYGEVGLVYNFTTNTTDIDGHQIKYGWDWNGDLEVDEWTNFFDSQEDIIIDHSWTEKGYHNISVKAKDYYNATSTWSESLTIYIHNEKPVISQPIGKTSLDIGESAVYVTNASDLDDHLVQCRLDWGDGSCSEWTSLSESGHIFTLSHSWIKPGTFQVRAQARDMYNLTSEWSDGLSVIISAEDWWPWWSMFRHDPLNTGSSPSSGPETNNISWTSQVEGTVQSSSPAVVDDKVYVTFDADEPGIYCFNATCGKQLWMKKTEGFGRSPAVVNGRVFLGAGDYFYCWNAETGFEFWKISTNGGVYVSPTVVTDKVYFASWFGEIYCLNTTDGDIIWSTNVGYGVHFTLSSPAVANGKLFIGSTESFYGKVYCFNVSNGNLLWTFGAGDDVKSSPVFAYDNLYVGADNGIFYCLDSATGLQNWAFQAGIGGFYIRSSPAILNDCVYFGSADHHLYCLYVFNGTEKWKVNLGSAIYSSPVIAAGKIYIGHLASSDKNILCLNASDGSEVWNYSTGEGAWSSPAIANGKLYIGERGKIHCFGSKLPYDPPEAPDPPYGPDEGIVGEEISLCVDLPVDPSAEPFSVLWDWGDGNFSDWMDPYSSGQTACTSYTWNSVGDYNVRVKIANKYGIQSNWSESFIIHIVEPGHGYIELADIKGGLGITVTIKNTGDAIASDLTLTVSIEGGLYISNRNISHDVGNVAPGESIEVSSQVFGIGLGRITEMPTITLTAESIDTDMAYKKIIAKIIGPLVILQ